MSGPEHRQRLVVPLQPGIATEVFRACLTEPFAREYGVEVDTPARSEHFLDDVRQDVEAGRFSYDVVEWPPHLFAVAKRAGLCEPLDFAAMPGLADMYPRYLDADGYGVGVFVYGMTLVYNRELVDSPPQSWADLWKPVWKSRIALRDQLGSSYLMHAVCKVLDISTEDLVDDAVFERAWRKLADLTRQVKIWAKSEGHVQQIMAEGSAAVSQQFIDVAQIQKDRGVPVEVVFPREGPLWSFRSWTVVKGSRQPDLARAFIEFAQAPAQQKRLCETFYGHPTNRKVDLDPALVPKIYGAPLDDADLTFPSWEWYVSRPDIEDRWQALIVSPVV